MRIRGWKRKWLPHGGGLDKSGHECCYHLQKGLFMLASESCGTWEVLGYTRLG